MEKSMLIMHNRNMTYEIPHRSKRAYDIRTWSTTWSDETMRRSKSQRSSRGNTGLRRCSRNFNFDDVHVEGAARIADAVAKYDCDRFVHVSSYNADKDSPSAFFRTKAQGEEVVRSIFPETTIVRPAPMFGWEDRLLNRFAGERSIWASNHLRELLRPVHVSCSISMATPNYTGLTMIGNRRWSCPRSHAPGRQHRAADI